MVFLLFAVLPAISSVAWAAEYPRRIAIAPFTILGPQEQIRQTVDILPRLLSSRLMALAGAEVLLLPAGEKSPDEAAKRSGLPLLLKGSVAKLGTGYSIDVTVTEPATGRMAGAFFASAATEDEIIFRLGDLAAEISEKLFGVKAAVRAYPPPPQAAAPGASPAGPQAAAMPPPPVPQPAPPAPTTLKEGWVPSALTKVGQSDKIADEIQGVVAGDVDADGNGEVVAFGKHILYIYRVKGTEILPFFRVSRGASHHFLNVDAIDLDGDGKKDLVVTDLVGDRLVSFVLLRRGDGFEEIPASSPYYLVVLRDWDGKTVVAGQLKGFGEAFQGKIRVMKWDGKTFSEGEAIPLDTAILPLSGGGVFSLAPARFGKDWRWLYIDAEDHLRVLDPGGKSLYRSKSRYGAPSDSFEYGEFSQLEGRRPMMRLRRPPRLVSWSAEIPLILLPEYEKGMFQSVIGTFESTRLVLLEMREGGGTERAATPKSDFLYTGLDVLPPGGGRKGGKFVASLIEQSGSVLKEKISRLALFTLE
jgi:hypothetical protein